jgi:hypothetical protein
MAIPMAVEHVCTGIPVADYGAGLTWYKSFFDRAPDVIINPTEAMWQATEGGWIYVVEDADRAGNALVTVLVDDLDGIVSGMSERGIAIGEVDEAPGLWKKTTIVDPEGNRFTYAEIRAKGG